MVGNTSLEFTDRERRLRASAHEKHRAATKKKTFNNSNNDNDNNNSKNRNNSLVLLFGRFFIPLALLFGTFGGLFFYFF